MTKPWDIVTNSYTGRIEVYLVSGNTRILVGSVPGTATDSDINGLLKKIKLEMEVHGR